MWLVVLNINGKIQIEEAPTLEAAKKTAETWLRWGAISYPQGEFVPVFYEVVRKEV